MKRIIESANTKQTKAAIAYAYAKGRFAYSFYSPLSRAVVRTVALFWSVFGPAARYGFKNPNYAYAALMKP